MVATSEYTPRTNHCTRFVSRETTSQVSRMATKTDVLSTGISRLAVNAVVATTVLSALGTFLAIWRFFIRRKDALGTDGYVLMVALVFLQLQLAFCYMSMSLLFHVDKASKYMDADIIVKLAS